MSWEGITTSRLLAKVRGADTFEDAVSYHRAVGEPSFKDGLYQLMQAKGMDATGLIRLSGIERSYFYHILSGRQVPARNMVIRLAFCMHCSLNEMNRLLRLAGFSFLYPRVRRDAVLIYAVQHRLELAEVNELLISAGEQPLIRRESHV